MQTRINSQSHWKTMWSPANKYTLDISIQNAIISWNSAAEYKHQSPVSVSEYRKIGHVGLLLN